MEIGSGALILIPLGRTVMVTSNPCLFLYGQFDVGVFRGNDAAVIGPAGNKVISIFKPRIAVKLFGNLSLGVEYLLYAKNSQLRDFPDVHAHNSEQKLYLMLYF